MLAGGIRQHEGEQRRRARLLQPKLGVHPEASQGEPDATRQLCDPGPLDVEAGGPGEAPDAPRPPVRINVAELFQ